MKIISYSNEITATVLDGDPDQPTGTVLNSGLLLLSSWYEMRTHFVPGPRFVVRRSVRDDIGNLPHAALAELELARNVALAGTV